MPIVSDESIELSIGNVAAFGDTDVFPFPIENIWFADEPAAVARILRELDSNFDEWLSKYPVVCQRSLAAVGYTGFRAATQIDAIWNAYLLALVLEIAAELEAVRIPTSRQTVFAYRFAPNQSRPALFDGDWGWGAFQRRALALSAENAVVLAADISDFYARIYHHRLENALKAAAPSRSEVIRRIIALLSRISFGTSYGLPVGGNAARILAEILLNGTDRLLSTNGIRFIRFVDDYFLFTQTQEEAQRALIFLCEILNTNEGLGLSRAKTRMMTASEFSAPSPFSSPIAEVPDQEAEIRQFLRLRLAYDPYSPTAPEDYAQLAEDLDRFDVVSMLARELHKSRVDHALARQLVRAIRFLKPPVRSDAAVTLVGSLGVLYPIFPTVAHALKALIGELTAEVRLLVFETIRGLLTSQSHVLAVPVNRAFALRILASDLSEESDSVLNSVYVAPRSDTIVRREVILAMAERQKRFWLSDVLKLFSTLSPWERRALLVASFTLGDEGSHWRRSRKAELSTVDQAFLEWLGKKNSGARWELPL